MAVQKKLVKRLVATLLAAALLAGFWPSTTLIMLGGVVALLMIWWPKMYWLAPVLALGGAVVILGSLLEPKIISTAWLWRGVSLCIEMLLLTAVTKISEDEAA